MTIDEKIDEAESKAGVRFSEEERRVLREEGLKIDRVGGYLKGVYYRPGRWYWKASDGSLT